VPTIDFEHYPELTKHRLITTLCHDLSGDYSVFVGSRLQGGNIIVSCNDWAGASVYIKQQEDKNLTQIGIKPTVPSDLKFAVAALVVFFSALGLFWLVKNDIVPVIATTAFLSSVGAALFYFQIRSRTVISEVTQLLQRYEELDEEHVGLGSV
jgi:hypothetical protein